MKTSLKHIGLPLVLILALLFASCSGSKKYAKKAGKFEENGFYKQAANYYLISLRKKNTNIDARNGLIINGQKVMDEYLREFFLAHNAEEYKKSVYSYLEAIDYYQEVNETGITLKIPEYYEGYYNQDLELYLTELYSEGTELLSTGQYTKADAKFSEINKLKPNYKDADRLAILSKTEPLYIKAETSFDQEHYREAYNYYTAVIALDKNYKEAIEKREYAHQKAMLTLAILNKHDYYIPQTGKMNSYVLNKLVDSNNPFLVIVDRTNVDKILEEQKIGMNGAINQNSAITAGNLMGVKVVLLGKVLSYQKEEGRLYQEEVEAFKKVAYQVYDKTTKSNKTHYRYDKTHYTTYSQKNRAEVSYQYELISVETGQVLSSNVFSDNLDDNIHYATYAGEVKNLYPKPGANYSERRNMEALFKSRKKITSSTQMLTNIYNSISKQVANKIVDYEKSRL